MDYVKKQGINGPVFALIALDTGDYEIPQTDAANPTTREKLVQTILDAQVANGGWTFFGSTADPDMTGMAIQALAPYYSTNSDVKRTERKRRICIMGFCKQRKLCTGTRCTYKPWN